ncbi:unnamed protein product [Caenorhabditis sp. 36 PRJEB53466]|nr:unnamed protein product [Caenorhabditis sp. 36 PRJEB53466]
MFGSDDDMQDYPAPGANHRPGGRSPMGQIKGQFTKQANKMKSLADNVQAILDQQNEPGQPARINALKKKLVKGLGEISNYKLSIEQKINENEMLKQNKNDNIKTVQEHCDQLNYGAIQARLGELLAKVERFLLESPPPQGEDLDEEDSDFEQAMGILNPADRTLDESRQEPAPRPTNYHATRSTSGQGLPPQQPANRGRGPQLLAILQPANHGTSGQGLHPPPQQPPSQQPPRPVSINKVEVERLQTEMLGQREIIQALQQQIDEMRRTSRQAQSSHGSPFYQEMARPTTRPTTTIDSVRDILDTLDSFSGEEPDKYPEFITQFDQLVNKNETFTDETKYCILKKLLKGDARLLVTTTTFSKADYEQTLKLLKATYSTDRRPILTATFRKLPFHASDFEEMEKDLAKHIITANRLKLYNIDINHPLIIEEFIKKTPNPIMTHVLRQLRTKELSFEDVTKTVREKIMEMRFIDDASHDQKLRVSSNEVCVAQVPERNGSSKYSKQNRFNKRNKDNSNDKKSNENKTTKGGSRTDKEGSSGKPKCFFCKSADHHPTKCTKPADEKKKVMNEEKRCLNCGTQGHARNNCKSSFSCFFCGKRHFSGMCETGDVANQYNRMSEERKQELRTFFRGPHDQ